MATGGLLSNSHTGTHRTAHPASADARGRGRWLCEERIAYSSGTERGVGSRAARPSPSAGRSEIFRLEPCPLGETGEHPGTDLVSIMEGEHRVGPPITCQDAMRSGFTLNAPSDAEQGGKDTGGLRSRPLTHAATKETFSSCSGTASPCSRRSARTRRASA